jgi:hypothetical protein
MKLWIFITTKQLCSQRLGTPSIFSISQHVLGATSVLMYLARCSGSRKHFLVSHSMFWEPQVLNCISQHVLGTPSFLPYLPTCLGNPKCLLYLPTCFGNEVFYRISQHVMGSLIILLYLPTCFGNLKYFTVIFQHVLGTLSVLLYLSTCFGDPKCFTVSPNMFWEPQAFYCIS